MGVNGLWTLIEPTSTCITMDAIEGKRLAIDFSIWIYQAQNGYGKHDSRFSKSPHLHLLLTRVAKLLYYKVRPVFVFDGEETPRFKKQILRDRSLKQHLNEIKNKTMTRTTFEQLVKKFSSHGAPSDLLPTDEYNIEPSTYGIRDIEAFNDSGDSDSVDEIIPIDKRITQVEELKKLKRNYRLQPDEIPHDVGQFCNFQLERLIERNNLNSKLEKLKRNKIRQNVHFPIGCNNQKKLIISDKQKRTHVLTRVEVDEDIRVVDLNSSIPFIKAQEKQCFNAKTELLSNIDVKCDNVSSSDDSDELQDVSDLDNDEIVIINRETSKNLQHAPCHKDSSSSSGEEIYDDETNEKAGTSIDQTKTNEEYFKAKSCDFIGNENGTNKDERAIYTDCQVLLTLLGIPFLQAPAEAEAQCVELERLGLVDGTVSDDSDVWLFGARNVYRHMFSRKAHLQKYDADKIKRTLGLKKGEFVQLGMLAGGDYTRGLKQVGITSALELISLFANKTDSIEDEFEKALTSLKHISAWIASGNQHNNLSKSLSGLRRTVEANNANILKEFPNEEIFEAYAKPKVNSFDKKFCWKQTDFDKLEHFLQQKLGLDQGKLNKMTFGALDKWNAFIGECTQSYQTRITQYTKPIDAFDGLLESNSKLDLPRKVQHALSRIKDATNTAKNGSGLKEIKQSEQRMPFLNRSCKKRRQKHRKKKVLIQKTVNAELNLSEESYSD